LEDPEIAIKFESEKGNPMVLNNGSLLQYHSAATQSQIESKTYHLIIIEEAQDVDPMKCRKSIRPMAAAYNGTIVQIGTCNTKRSDFFDSIRQNIRSEQETKRKTHYQYDYKVAMKYNPYYKKFVMKEMKKLGYDSDEFRMAYRLHWIFERGMFTTQEALESLYDRAYKHVQMNSRDYCVVGMDIGKSEDSTVVTVGKVNWGDVDEFGRPQVDVLNWLEIVGDDHESQFEQVKDFLAPYNVQVFVIDATGKGDPVADRWANFLYGKSEVIGVTFSRQTKSESGRILTDS
jgi:hypothetical protein